MAETPPVVKQTCEDFIGAPSGRGFEKSYRCAKCGLTFKEGQTVSLSGKRLGVPCGCSKDGK